MSRRQRRWSPALGSCTRQLTLCLFRNTDRGELLLQNHRIWMTWRNKPSHVFSTLAQTGADTSLGPHTHTGTVSTSHTPAPVRERLGLSGRRDTLLPANIETQVVTMCWNQDTICQTIGRRLSSSSEKEPRECLEEHWPNMWWTKTARWWAEMCYRSTKETIFLNLSTGSYDDNPFQFSTVVQT